MDLEGEILELRNDLREMKKLLHALQPAADVLRLFAAVLHKEGLCAEPGKSKEPRD